jgi:hypothetical protein
MSTQSSCSRLLRLFAQAWSGLRTAWKSVVIASAAVVLISCGTESDIYTPTETASETETASPATPSERETTTRPELTQAPTTSASPSPSPSSPPATTADDDVYYENCDAARDAGVDPLYEGDPGYAPHLDGDGDGIACEPYFRDDTGGAGGNGDGDDGDSDVYYKNCDAARAAGAAPVYEGEPGYGSHLDRDGDGVGCE